MELTAILIPNDELSETKNSETNKILNHIADKIVNPENDNKIF